MGVLGWTEEQALATTIPAIEAALVGRIRFVNQILERIFGKAEPDKPVSVRPMTPELFDAIFG